jgi:diguanylate cyclase (GGDEF)-like protein
MVFLHALLAHPRLASGAGPGASGPWDLALSLYREVVAADPGRGRREVEGVRELEAGRPAGPHPVPEAPAGAPLVLVADDSPMVRRLLEAVLGRECRVISAGDGAEAVALAREHRPDLVLMDILMPNQDGYEACADLKADPGTRDIPVLFLTALQGEMEEVRALEAGAIDFIQKPIVASTVLARVRAHVALKRSKDQLLELAVRDGLTSLANRRQFDQVLRQEWQRGRRQEKPLSLVMGDIDSFKKFNDAYGHPRGDECLKAVAGIFRSAAKRPGDLAARYGGEEFICLLPGTDEVGARTVAEEIREGLEALAIPHGHSPVSPWVTVSLGAATIVPGFQEDPTVLVEAADRAMYEVKRRARERANPPEAPGRMG